MPRHAARYSVPPAEVHNVPVWINVYEDDRGRTVDTSSSIASIAKMDNSMTPGQLYFITGDNRLSRTV